MRLRPYLGTGLAVLVFAGSWVYLVSGIDVGAGVDNPPFFIDEAHKLGEAYYWHLLFEQRDIHHPAWHEDFYGRTNPTVGKYVFGAALALAGEHVRDLQFQEDFERHWTSWDELRWKIPDRMLRITRYTSALYGSLVCMLLFVIGRRIGGVVPGLAASALLLATPFFRDQARLGLTDVILMFHMTLIVPVTMWAAAALIRQWRSDRSGHAVRRWSMMCVSTVLVPGLVIALAAGTKLNGALAGLVYAGGVTASAARCVASRPWWRRIGLALLVSGLASVVASVVFVGMNPYYYDHPVARAVQNLRVFDDWMLKQRVSPGGALFGVKQKVTAMCTFNLRNSTLPLPRYLGELGTWITVLGFAVGSVYLVARSLGARRAAGEPAPQPNDTRDSTIDAAIILCWLVVYAVAVTAWLPVSWHRYLMPPYPVVCVTTAIGFANLLRLVVPDLDAPRGWSAGFGRYGLVSMVIASAAVWLVLCFTTWIISPTLLTPRGVSKAAASGPLRAYEEGVRNRPDSPLLRHNLAAGFMQQGLYDRAAEQLGKALELMAPRSTDGLDVVVQRCAVLYDIARVRSAMGDRAGAMQAFRQHVAVVEKLRDGMITTDPKVRADFNRVITDRKRQLDTILDRRPNTPDPVSARRGRPQNQ